MKKKQLIYSLTLATTVLSMASGWTKAEVKADTVAAPSISSTNAESTTKTETASVVTEITSPVVYQENENEAIGYRNVLAQGQAGQLVIAADKTVTRVEPTETVIELGTKSTVEEVVVEKAVTEYVVDETKEFGIKEVVQEAQDSVQVTTTDYRIAPESSTLASEKASDDRYRFTEEKFYSIDDSQALPSDKIVIDKLYLQAAPTADKVRLLSNEEKSLREIVVGGNHGPESRPFPVEIVKSDDPEIVKTLEALYGHLDMDSRLRWPRYVFDTSAVNLLRVSSGAYLSGLSADGKEAGDIQTYYTSHAMSSGLYADIKADYLRLTEAKAQLEAAGVLTEDLSNYYATLKETYDILTQTYNNSQGVIGTIIDYSTTSMSQERRAQLEEKINQLPPAFRKNLVKLRVTDEKLPAGLKTDEPKGVAYYRHRLIVLHDASQWIKPTYQSVRTNPHTGKIEVLDAPRKDRDSDILNFNLRVLFHEMAHNIDFNSGLNVVGELTDGIMLQQIGLSKSKEFIDLYETYVKGKVLAPYYRDNREETFAEGFARYLMKRYYQQSYPHYMEHEGEIYTIRPGEEFYEATDSPLEKLEFYFASLYTKLFEQPQEAKVVVDTIKVAPATPTKKGIISLGTKPVVEEVVLPFTRREQADANLLVGERKVIQAGKDGKLKKVTTYQLVDKTTGELKPTVAETILAEMVEEIIAVGSKQVPEKEETTVLAFVPTTAPVYDLPTFDAVALSDLAKLAATYDLTVDATGLLTAVPKTSPAVDLPIIDGTESNHSAVPITSPMADDLPIFYDMVPNTAPIVENLPIVDSYVPDYTPIVADLPTFDAVALSDLAKLAATYDLTVDVTGLLTAVPKTSLEVVSNDLYTAVPDTTPVVTLSTADLSQTAPKSAGNRSEKVADTGAVLRKPVTASETKKLPETGESMSLLDLLGLGLIGVAAVSRRKDNEM